MSANGASKRTHATPAGSFADLETLLEQLDRAPPIMELGNPLPNERHLPSRKRSITPAQVNRLLLDPSRRGRDRGSL